MRRLSEPSPYVEFTRRQWRALRMSIPMPLTADEVERLLARGVPDTATAMQAIGYKEIVQALRGQTTMDEAVRLIQQRSRNYAKRQLTWFRADLRVTWLEPAGKTAAALAEEIAAAL